MNLVLCGSEHGMGNSTSRSKYMDLRNSWTTVPSAQAKVPLATAKVEHLQKIRDKNKGRCAVWKGRIHHLGPF